MLAVGHDAFGLKDIALSCASGFVLCLPLSTLASPTCKLCAAADFENVGSLTEVAMFHHASRTLLLTDAVVFVPQEAPEVVPRPQLTTAGSLPWCVGRRGSVGLWGRHLQKACL